MSFAETFSLAHLSGTGEGAGQAVQVCSSAVSLGGSIGLNLRGEVTWHWAF